MFVRYLFAWLVAMAEGVKVEVPAGNRIIDVIPFLLVVIVVQVLVLLEVLAVNGVVSMVDWV